jgi:cephalosporin-C deacetylase
VAQFDLPLEQLRTYRPDVREPRDFDDFWATTLAQSREIGGDVAVEQLDARLPHVDIYDVTFPGFRGQPIKAWLSRPAGAGGDLPIVVQYQGYGGGRGLPFEHTFWPSAGFAHLMMDTRGQGSSWGNGGDTPDPDGAGPSLPGFMTRGIENPETYYYRRLFTDAVRAVDTARSLPGVDPSRTVIAGGSQGGGMVLAVAGLVPDVAVAMPDVAFLCHYERAVTITDADPYGEIRRYLSIHRDVEEQTFTTLSYFDGVNFAKRALAPSVWSVGLFDEICPPSTTFAAYNWYGHGARKAPRKEMTVYPFNGHEGGAGHQGRLQWEFAREVLSGAS